MTLAGTLRDFRRRAGLKTTEVARRIGKSPKTVSGWEHGRGQPDADMLVALCALYQVDSIAAFFGGAAPCPVAPALTAEEWTLVTLWRSAETAAREIALEVLQHHQRPANEKKA